MTVSTKVNFGYESTTNMFVTFFLKIRKALKPIFGRKGRPLIKNSQ
jgi:hypothetical protein